MLRALDLVEALEDGDLSLNGVVELIIEAVADLEPQYHCFAHFDAELLRGQALERGRQGALQGLPVAFKDIIDTALMPTAYGSPIYTGWQPKADAAVVSMTEAAGGLVLGKAETCEFAFLEPARTINPAVPQMSPGGSSVGSAAGVAGGLMPLAFGTQTGGSVIRPASYCGVTGFKPSFRLLPTVGVKTGAWTLDTMGLFGARVVDVAYGMAAVTGRDLRVDDRDFGTPVFGVTRMAFAGTAEPEAEAALRFAIRALEHAGATIIDLDIPTAWVEAHEAHPVLYHYEGALALAWEIKHHSDKLSTILKHYMAPEHPVSVAQYDDARRMARGGRRASRDVFAGVDAILTYSAPGAAPDRSTTGVATFNRLFTLLGLPALNVAGYQTADGQPIGVQVVAAFGDDLLALAAGHYVEEALRKAV